MSEQPYYMKVFNDSCKAQVRKVFFKFSNYFKSNAIDQDDLEQEMLLVVWETIERHKDKPDIEIRKICSTAVKRQLIVRVKDSLKHGLSISFDDVGAWLVETEQAGRYLRQGDSEINILLEVLKEELTEVEFDVIYKKCIENKSLRQISKELKMSMNWGSYIWTELEKKLRKKLKYNCSK